MRQASNVVELVAIRTYRWCGQEWCCARDFQGNPTSKDKITIRPNHKQSENKYPEAL